MTIKYDWAVIGAGPAGIAAIGKLIDNQIKPERILWIDPEFKVGDFGTKWRKVPSNTKVSLFLKFLNACQSFRYSECKEEFALNSLNPDLTCELNKMADPLQWVTDHLKKAVHAHQGVVTQLKLHQRSWEISLKDSKLQAKNIILATGADPKALNIDTPEMIPLHIALNTDLLPQYCNSADTVAVFGSSHSAILIIRNLLEACDVKKVINFYQSPLCYAVYLENEILFDDTGLKGTTADWARENIDGTHPEKLYRIHSQKRDDHLSQCTKAIHAVGFKPRHIQIDGLAGINYNDRSGIIAPGLFGFGIAFPEAKTDRFGTVEYRVGLWKFMDYLTRVLPVWLKYHP